MRTDQAPAPSPPPALTVAPGGVAILATTALPPSVHVADGGLLLVLPESATTTDVLAVLDALRNPTSADPTPVVPGRDEPTVAEPPVATDEGSTPRCLFAGPPA